MATFIFTKYAEKHLHALDTKVQNRILLKLKELKKHKRITTILKPLRDVKPATHRLRIGDYRLILQQEEEETFVVLDIGHRSKIFGELEPLLQDKNNERPLGLGGGTVNMKKFFEPLPDSIIQDFS